MCMQFYLKFLNYVKHAANVNAIINFTVNIYLMEHLKLSRWVNVIQSS
jgi:hypothetical protein